MNDNQRVKMLVRKGYFVEKSGVSIQDISYIFPKRMVGKRYQVISENQTFLYNSIYSDLEIAVDKFFGILLYVSNVEKIKK